MYESPLELVVEKMGEQIVERMDAMFIQACIDAHVEVNRDELIAALKYDRGQYDKGFADGFLDGHAQATRELVHCEICAHYQLVGSRCDFWKAEGLSPFGYCSEGVEIEEDEEE